jgi:hypothetical protein
VPGRTSLRPTFTLGVQIATILVRRTPSSGTLACENDRTFSHTTSGATPCLVWEKAC